MSEPEPKIIEPMTAKKKTLSRNTHFKKKKKKLKENLIKQNFNHMQITPLHSFIKQINKYRIATLDSNVKKKTYET